WCHVMEHESFENEAIAHELNARFVCVKVDREERPDLDQIYMNAVQIMTGRGGWPMSVFLTPDLQPFFGGTYWPPSSRMGMPGFDQVIRAVDDAWQNRREAAVEQATELTRHLQQAGVIESSGEGLTSQLLTGAAAHLERVFDFRHGGFGSAPKFPHPMDVQLLLRVWRRHPRDGVLHMVRLTLDKMASGGIYDHLGGGFARYSVDERWLVPHFEKMLYDNGLLASAYLDGYLATGDPQYARIVRETCDYVLRDMTDAAGGFHSTEDADSEGEEGKFYVWSPQEVRELLGDERAERFCYVYDVTDSGNFEGHSILNLPKSIEQCAALRHWDVDELRRELAESRQALFAAREQRVRPGKDDKVLVSWNALMIDALARAAGVLDEPRYLQAAQAAAHFIREQMRRPDGRLLHAWRGDQAKFDAYLDDYAYLANALVSLYMADLDECWIDWAVELAETMLSHFADDADGGFYFTAEDHEQLIARNKDLHDASVPSGNAMAATALVRLGKLTGRQEFLEAAKRTLKFGQGLMARSPAAAGQMLIAADMWLGPFVEIAILGDPAEAATRDALSGLRRSFLPNAVWAVRDSVGSAGSTAHLGALFAGKTATERESPTVYVCENFACQAPVTGEAIAEKWRALSTVTE
ncbi:MAG: thioredoxin domain-containing protein, partial [Planctomycetales bacterium]|nr:thioredoxin domain-containing protein [Planctomycetales bacterium]